MTTNEWQGAGVTHPATGRPQLVVHPPDADHHVGRAPRLDHRLQVHRLRNRRLVQLALEGHFAGLVHRDRGRVPEEAIDYV